MVACPGARLRLESTSLPSLLPASDWEPSLLFLFLLTSVAVVALLATGWPSGWFCSVPLGAHPTLLPQARAFRLGSSKPPEAEHGGNATSQHPAPLPSGPGQVALPWCGRERGPWSQVDLGQWHLGPALYLSEPVSLCLK